MAVKGSCYALVCYSVVHPDLQVSCLQHSCLHLQDTWKHTPE